MEWKYRREPIFRTSTNGRIVARLDLLFGRASFPRRRGKEEEKELGRLIAHLNIYTREYKSNRFIKGPGVDGGARGAAATAGFSGAWPGKQDDGRGTAILRLVGKKGRKRERGGGEGRGREATRYTSPSLPLLPFGCSIN